MESKAKASLERNAKIINLAAYKRKKLIQRKKFWFIAIGMIVFILSSVIYFGEEITQYVYDQNESYQDINIGMPLQ